MFYQHSISINLGLVACTTISQSITDNKYTTFSVFHMAMYFDVTLCYCPFMLYVSVNTERLQ